MSKVQSRFLNASIAISRVMLVELGLWHMGGGWHAVYDCMG